jgi:hypothetical protein
MNALKTGFYAHDMATSVVRLAGLLDELVRKRSGGLLHLEIHQPQQSLDSLASLLDRFLADAPAVRDEQHGE